MHNTSEYITEQFANSAQLKKDFGRDNADKILETAQLMIQAINAGGKLLICGNGGSAADAQHFAAEMIGRLRRDRDPIGAIALTTDSSNLTAIGNDYSFDDVFWRQVQSLGSENDILIGLSTSGNSMNVIKAVESAKKKNIKTIALLGKDGGALSDLVDAALVVPAQSSMRIQEVHITVVHMWCELIEDAIFPNSRVL
jgi:D-sedoheptulose 7-phosphate isomerase